LLNSAKGGFRGIDGRRGLGFRVCASLPCCAVPFPCYAVSGLHCSLRGGRRRGSMVNP